MWTELMGVVRIDWVWSGLMGVDRIDGCGQD